LPDPIIKPMITNKMLNFIKIIFKFHNVKYLFPVILPLNWISINVEMPVYHKSESTQVQNSKPVSIVRRSYGGRFRAKNFYSSVVDRNNTKWFLTEAGIVSFDGKKWSVNNKNKDIPDQNLRNFAIEFSTFGPELWIATPRGATVASLPIDARSGATTYHTQNSEILSDNVLSVAVGNDSLRWFGTEKGISAFLNSKWLPYTGYSYKREYPESLFKKFPITSMATSPDGNFLYAGTNGGGVARVFRNEVDGISGASAHAYWGPINMPSDNVYSICITPDGTQWYGTDKGIAKHTGTRTLDNWTVFTTKDGLVDNFVQAIAIDTMGRLWFGTKGGVSVFDGSSWISYTRNDGLKSINIQCITVDKDGIIWLGTDNGVMCWGNGEFTVFK
jgi:ligand-binding sensor domain-containing protein